MRITATLRCTSKNLMPGVPPAAGGPGVDMISAYLQVQPAAAPETLTGTVTLTYAISADQLQLGNYYEMTLADGTPPVGGKQ